MAGKAYPLGLRRLRHQLRGVLGVAERVELCLFDTERRRNRVAPEVDGFVWHCYLPNIEPGQCYGYRVHGPDDPARGQRCNPNKLLLDPTPRPSTATSTGTSRCSATTGEPDGRNDDDSAPDAEVRRRRTRTSTGVDRPPQREMPTA